VDALDGIELLVYLCDSATQERFCCSHKWSIGDALMWDNTGSVHRATPYPFDCGCTLHRAKLQGEQSLA
jgi:alpha-ketoglutarate-dependent taurine dioxygenase